MEIEEMVKKKKNREWTSISVQHIVVTQAYPMLIHTVSSTFGSVALPSLPATVSIPTSGTSVPLPSTGMIG